MVRYEATVEDETVYVHTAEDRLVVGDLDTILELVGGSAWTITYSDREKERHPELDTSDEGLTVDVVDTIEAMTFGESFVETLEAQPATPVAVDDAAADGDDVVVEGDDLAADGEEAAAGGDGPEGVSPRTGLFVGRLLENLEYGVR